MTPPVMLTTLFFFAVGNKCQGSAEAAAARFDDYRFIISHVKSSLSRLELLAQRNSLLFLHVSRREVRAPAAQEVYHDTDKQIS